jgi:hypothetical protein
VRELKNKLKGRETVKKDGHGQTDRQTYRQADKQTDR